MLKENSENLSSKNIFENIQFINKNMQYRKSDKNQNNYLDNKHL